MLEDSSGRSLSKTRPIDPAFKALQVLKSYVVEGAVSAELSLSSVAEPSSLKFELLTT